MPGVSAPPLRSDLGAEHMPGVDLLGFGQTAMAQFGQDMEQQGSIDVRVDTLGRVVHGAGQGRSLLIDKCLDRCFDPHTVDQIDGLARRGDPLLRRRPLPTPSRPTRSALQAISALRWRATPVAGSSTPSTAIRTPRFFAISMPTARSLSPVTKTASQMA